MPADRAYVPDMSPATLMTAEALLHVRIPDKRVELVKGVLVVREPAGYRHGRVAMNLAMRLGAHVERAGVGQLFAAETGFALVRGPDTVRAPDIAFIRRERLPAHDPAGFIDPQRRLARVYRHDGTEANVTSAEALDGEDVLPGFTCSIEAILQGSSPPTQS